MNDYLRFYMCLLCSMFICAYCVQCLYVLTVFNVYPTLEADFYFVDISTVVPYEKIHQVKHSVMQHQ
jgi:hypothetical protein